MTNSHDGCKYQFDHGKCGCSCHVSPAPVKKRGRTKKVEGITPTIIVVDEATEYVDPRPWKRKESK